MRTTTAVRRPRAKSSAAGSSPGGKRRTKVQRPAPVPASPARPRTPEQQAEVDEFYQRRGRRPALPAVKAEIAGRVATLSFDHGDKELAGVRVFNSMGLTDGFVLNGLLCELSTLTSGKDGVPNVERLNYLLGLAAGLEPRDTTEAMLAVQMAATHKAMIKAAERLKSSEFIVQYDSYVGAMNKLARTFALQVEALKKHRSSGEQCIRVQHVHVNEGGQAIVAGKVSTGGGGTQKNERQPHEPTDGCERGAAVLREIEAHALALPSPGDAGPERVPLPRCDGRRPLG